jgi:hypothetical protein
MGLFDSSGLNATPTQSSQQDVSKPFQPYVSDLLNKTQALTDAGTPAYTGQLTAGPSTLQNQAWQGLASLTVPTALQNAGSNLDAISRAEANTSFTPQQFTDTYTGPAAYQGTNFTNQYQAANPYQASNIQSTYQSPANQYKPTDVTTGTFNQAAAEQYMNPYIQQALNPQLEALKRQQAINQQADMAKLTQAGAFGGSRQAILQGQNNYNLLQQQANLVGQGYNQAYNQAAQQFQADQARNLQAQQANVQQAQFAAQQGMTDAQMKAQYGMTAAQANEASRQFAQNQAATAAQLQAQYGLSAQQANEAAKQYGYTQQMTQAQLNSAAEQARQQAQENAAQFGATYGLQGLQAAQQAQTAAANAGAQQAQYGLANLQALSTAGGQQQALNQAADNAQYNEFLRQLKAPQDMLTLQRNILSGLPISTTNTYDAAKTGLSKAAGAVSGVTDLYNNLKKNGMGIADIAKYINGMAKQDPSSTGGVTIDKNGNLVYPQSPSGGTPYDDNGNLNPGWGYDEENNPVWVSNDYIEPNP